MNTKKTIGVAIFAVAALAGIWWDWEQRKDAVKASLETSLERFSVQAASVINADDYQAMLSKGGQISRPEYERLLKPLVNLHLTNPDIAHLYTASILGGNAWVILDTSGEIKKSPKHVWQYNPPNGRAIHKIEAPDAKLDEALKSKQTTWQKDTPTRSDFGADVAIYQPLITTNGELAGILATTMNQSAQKAGLAAAQKQAFIHLGGLIVLCGIILVIGGESKAESLKEKNKRERLEDQFRTMTQRIPGVVFIFAGREKRNKGEFLFMSGGIETLRGIPAKEAETDWKEIIDILPIDSQEQNREKIAKAIRENNPLEVEFENCGKWIQLAAQPQRQEEQTLWFGTMIDISNRKRDEEKLAQTNRILSQISQSPNVKTTLEGICEFGEDPNETACVIHWVEGDKIRAVAGKGIAEAVAQVLAKPRKLEKSEGAAATCSIGDEANHIASISDSGLYRNAQDLKEILLADHFQSTTCYPIKSGGKTIGAVEFLHKTLKSDPEHSNKDIQTIRLAGTALERMYNMQVLQENERRYRTLFENSPVGICELDQEHKKVFSNNTYENDLQPETKEKIEFSEEEHMEIKDGKRTLLVESRNIQKADGKIHRITFAYDISEQKNKEERALISKHAAEEANKEKSRFLAVMSHEIRTPLHGILGFAGLLEKEVTEARLKSYANRILKCGKTLNATINDILDLSKIEAGKIDVEKHGFDPEEVLENCKELLKTKADEKGIGIKLITKGLYPIHNDETRFSQIVTNLIGNAVKFTEKGEVTISATIKDEKLFVAIKDTGIGISPEQQKRLFQPFSQADPSTTRRFGGTGLGLVISQKLCELLGGEIKLESEFGKGTTFTFWIDAPKGEVIPKTKSLQENEEVLPLNILVAEDDETNRALIGPVLKGLGHEVEFAINGQDAIRRTKELGDWVDIILMDMRMPELDGIEATQEIVKQGLKKFPIIALTANAMQEDRERCMAAGMDNYLSKPLDIAILQRALQICQKNKVAKSAADAAAANAPVETKTSTKKKKGEDSPSVVTTTDDNAWGGFGFYDEEEVPDGELEFVNEVAFSSYLKFVPAAVAVTLVEKVKQSTLEHTEIILNPEKPSQLKAKAAHSMFGAVGTLGCTELSKIAKILENHFDQSSEPHPEMDRLLEIRNKTVEELEKQLNASA